MGAFKKTLFDKNGGHAMFFDGVDKRYMAIHCLEKPPLERALFIKFKESDLI